MTTFTQMVAAVVVHSSTVAYSHFGVVLEPPKTERPVAERVIARTPASTKRGLKVADCPDQRPAPRPSAVKV